MLSKKKVTLLTRLVRFNDVMKNVWLFVGIFVAIYLIFMGDGLFINWIDGSIIILSPFLISLFHFVLLILGEDEDVQNIHGFFNCDSFKNNQDLVNLSKQDIWLENSDKSIFRNLKARINAFDKHRED